MLRVADDKARLLAPLSRLEDPAAAEAASVPEAIPAGPVVDEVDAATAPVTAARPNAEVAPLPEPATAEALGPAKKPKRDVTILIPVLAVVTGLLAIAALVAVLVE